MATPTSPSNPSFPLSTSPPSDPDTFLSHSKPALTLQTTSYPSPSSPSFASSLCTSNASRISSPEPSDSLPFPASRLTPAKLAHLLDQSQQGSLRAGSRRPLILDLRPHPDFYPISIAHSININLPTLLMRRYRRGVAVTSFALESFITIPSDKDAYHQILEGWRASTAESEEPHDVIFDGVNTRMWFLEGGFDAFQAWDASEKFLVRADGKTPVRRESLFSLNTKALQRPAGLSRSQTENQDNEQEISCILPGFLYLGPEIVTNDQVEELDRLGVKRILNMATECEDVLVAHRPGMEYHKIGVYDNIEADVSAGLLQAVDIIGKLFSQDTAIYVHCKAGKSRSVTATIAYLISHLQWPLNKAYKHVLTNRPCMCPNLGFVAELIEMEKHILGDDHARGLQLHQLG
ncbi:MAG: protein-tyrosine phosphatase-like protein [Linnemannia elongata]|nr:MAG: protein-tyrosine phosphatase-like protein [Linnemannia elongata]